MPGVDILFIVSNLIFNHVFSVDSNGLYEREFLYNLTLIYPFVILMSSMISAIRCNLNSKEKFTLIIYCVTPYISMVAQIFTYYSILPLCELIAFIIVYGNVYSQRGKKIAQQNAELADRRLDVTISQIQPHFLYNTLTAIYQLCEMDTELAQKTIKDFSTYLRNNMDGIKSTKPVPFEKEYAHTKTYLEIEMLRFSDILKVDYDIEVTDFEIPSLTLQPLVENAVKYGIRSREDGGTVTISTKKKNGKIYISVHDDGMGFDINEKTDDNRSHIGIENTRQRLKLMMNADLVIDSKIGVGTTATIILDDNNLL